MTRPDTAPITRRRMLAACSRGDLTAEALSTQDREELIQTLWTQGLTDTEIAAHITESTYTTGRIRARLGLAAHQV